MERKYLGVVREKGKQMLARSEDSKAKQIVHFVRHSAFVGGLIRFAGWQMRRVMVVVAIEKRKHGVATEAVHKDLPTSKRPLSNRDKFAFPGCLGSSNISH